MNSQIAIIPFFAILCFLFLSCSGDDDMGMDSDANLEMGTITVTGDFEAQHEGISQYVGLRSTDGGFLNLALHINEHPLTSMEEDDFSFAIRMVGEEGPFDLEVGEYEIGHEAANDALILVTYNNKIVADETVIYGTYPNSTGTITISNISSTSIEATFDLNLDIDETGEEGTVNVTGELNAKCLTAEAGTGC